MDCELDGWRAPGMIHIMRTRKTGLLATVLGLLMASAALAQTEPVVKSPAAPVVKAVQPARAVCPKKLVVATKMVAPFVMNRSDGTCCEGFSIDLWTELVSQMNKGLARGATPYTFWDGKTQNKTFLTTGSLTELLNTVRHGAADKAASARKTRADVAIAAITITPKRGMDFSFTQSYFDSGLRIMIRTDEEGGAANILSQIFSVALLELVGVLVLVILLAAHIIWLLERKRNPDHFRKGYVGGVFDAIWWAAVTLTTVGYGDMSPETGPGQAMDGVIWVWKYVWDL